MLVKGLKEQVAIKLTLIIITLVKRPSNNTVKPNYTFKNI